MPFEDPSPPKRLLENPTHGFTSVMVVIHRAHGFRFVIYTSDHEPAHVHIAGSGRAKINLVGRGGKPELIASAGINRRELRRLIHEVTEHRDAFLAEWERIHGRDH